MSEGDTTDLSASWWNQHGYRGESREGTEIFLKPLELYPISGFTCSLLGYAGYGIKWMLWQILATCFSGILAKSSEFLSSFSFMLMLIQSSYVCPELSSFLQMCILLRDNLFGECYRHYLLQHMRVEFRSCFACVLKERKLNSYNRMLLYCHSFLIVYIYSSKVMGWTSS